MIRLALVFALSAAVAPAAAQTPAPSPMAMAACAAVDDATLPPALSAWTHRTTTAAAVDPSGLTGATLTVGQGADARLRPIRDVTFPVAPSRPGAPASYGGLFALPITAAGDYQVSLGAGAWVEMVREGRSVASARHAPGPACTTLKKTVVFPLQPGAYVLEIAGNGAPVLPLLVTPVR